jgi:hypothetical protein
MVVRVVVVTVVVSSMAILADIGLQQPQVTRKLT